jgi:hypothetical protein
MRSILSLCSVTLLALPLCAADPVTKAPPVTVDDRLTKIEQRLDAIEKKLVKADASAKAQCVCGDSCQCPAGVCPAKCPTACTVGCCGNQLLIGGVPHVCGTDGCYRAAPGYTSLQLTAPTYTAPVFGFGGSCANGQCSGRR